MSDLPLKKTSTPYSGQGVLAAAAWVLISGAALFAFSLQAGHPKFSNERLQELV